MTFTGRNGSPTPIHESIIDALLPNCTDPALDDLANATFIDAGVAVPVSPVDQLLMVLARRLLTDPTLGGTAVVQLPRSMHRSALLLAITSHLLCRQAPAQLTGPAVLIGFDVDLATQLRSLSVQSHRRMGLASGNPLSAHRLTRTGALQPVIGTDVGMVDTSLVYFNTRIGRPTLGCHPPLVILDATSVTHPAARARAIDWALDHHAAAIIALGDIGDDGLVETVTATGVVPTVLAVNDTVTALLADNLGRGPTSPSALSSMSLLWRNRTRVVIHRVASETVNEAVSAAFRTMAFKPDGPVPAELDLPLNLLRNGTRLAARVRDYRTACTNNPRPGELPLVLRLDRATFQLPGAWRNWQITRLGSLKVAVRALWREIEEDNPKLRELWRVLDDLDRTATGKLLIRCHSRAAAEATRASLATGDRSSSQEQLWNRINGRVTVATFKERFSSSSFGTQILTGAPPPWLLSLLVGVEATETHVLTYDAEDIVLGRQGQRWARAATQWQRAACRTLGAGAPAAITSPIPTSSVPAAPRAAAALHVPGLTLAEVLDLAADVLDPPETDASPGALLTGTGARVCVPVRLDDGRTWWCVDEGHGGGPVLTVTAGGPSHRPVRDLKPGDHILVPAGEGTESIHARLVTASRSNDDVRSLDLILSQFRSAAKSLLVNGTQREAIERVRIAGATAPDQLSAWARGTTIAPREPGDVEAVFRAARRLCPDLGLIYAVAGTLRSLNRTLGRFIAAIASGRGDDAVDRLRAIVGPVADELMDEFVIAEVREVGESRTVPSSVAGKIQ
jgi:hypothetical protein